jgi:DNA repair photolyase
MKAIYEPRGRAKEYGELAVNLYNGCGHSCLYCYVPDVMRKNKDDFHASVTPRKGILDALKKEAPMYKGREVFMCFTCDPYNRKQEDDVTRDAIKILHSAEVGVRILTKAGLASMIDFDLLSANPHLSVYGATMTFINHEMSREWEPNAADPIERSHALFEAKALGIETFISVEPVINPNEALKVIQIQHASVHEFKIGKWNHDKRAKEIDWHKFGHDAVELCERLGVKYYIKQDLRDAMEAK